jgi:hypothetical protein
MRRVALLIGLIVLTGCSSTPSRPQTAGPVFAKPPAVVQKAAVNALVVNGFDVQKDEPLYVQGYKPRKVGVIVGSGGETVGVWLEPVGDDRTRVRVDTAKTFVGMAGQRTWDADILAAMEKELGRPQ